MEKEFIPYEQALALKELGFDEPCFGYYYNRELSFGARTSYGEVVEAPTFSQAFRWFREKYGLIGWVEGKQVYRYCIENDIPTDGQLNLSPFKTYEEAEFACLRKLIEIVKQNNKTQHN